MTSIISILEKAHCEKIKLHFLIIDNGNVSPLKDALARLQNTNVTVIRLDENRGGAGAYAYGMNFALSSDYDYLWLIDDDAEPDERTLPELLKTADALKKQSIKIGAIASSVIDSATRRVIESGGYVRGLYGKLRHGYAGKKRDALPIKNIECDYAAATSLLIPVRVVRETGVFAQVFIHYDDVEWSFRARAKGYRIFVSTASQVSHPTWQANFALWLHYYNTRNKLWFLQNYLSRQWRFCRMLVICKMMLLYLTGNYQAAALMKLGMKHSVSGKLLMKSEVETFCQKISR